MASVDSSRVKKKYVVLALRDYTSGTPTDVSGVSSHGNGHPSLIWVSGNEDTYATPALTPFDDIADALSYADELNNNRISGWTYNSPTGGPTVESGHESDDGFTYYWGVMEVWAIDPAVDPS